jgi:hypothetical protein
MWINSYENKLSTIFKKIIKELCMKINIINAWMNHRNLSVNPLCL